MTRLTVGLCVAGAVLAGIVVGTASSGAQSAGPPTGTLTLVSPDKGTTFKFVDNPPLKKESAGDMAVLAGRLQGTDGSAQGRFQAVFVATRTGNFEKAFRGQASATLMLPGGDIAIEGVTDDKRSPEPFPIVGGTGSYAGARGTVTVTEGKSRTTFELTFMP